MGCCEHSLPTSMGTQESTNHNQSDVGCAGMSSHYADSVCKTVESIEPEVHPLTWMGKILL